MGLFWEGVSLSFGCNSLQRPPPWEVDSVFAVAPLPLRKELGVGTLLIMLT